MTHPCCCTKQGTSTSSRPPGSTSTSTSSRRTSTSTSSTSSLITLYDSGCYMCSGCILPREVQIDTSGFSYNFFGTEYWGYANGTFFVPYVSSACYYRKIVNSTYQLDAHIVSHNIDAFTIGVRWLIQAAIQGPFGGAFNTYFAYTSDFATYAVADGHLCPVGSPVDCVHAGAVSGADRGVNFTATAIP